MSGAILSIGVELKDRLWAHLLSTPFEKEQAAFLYCRCNGEPFGFDVAESELLTESDFAFQESDYLELTSETRIRLIKRAHALGACLAELHSHPSEWPAEFSPSDRRGLKETVRHMSWRLNGQPYLAFVVALSSYDGLVWAEGTAEPKSLELRVAGKRLPATSNSLGGW